jgi:hypothetical protein
MQGWTELHRFLARFVLLYAGAPGPDSRIRASVPPHTHMPAPQNLVKPPTTRRNAKTLANTGDFSAKNFA